MVNKKGQEMSVATLVLIVIGIVVLVMVILGFTMGWQSLWSKINIFGGGSDINTIVQACNLAATSDSVYSYCNEFKQIKSAGKTEYLNCEDSRVVGFAKTLDCASVRTAGMDYCGEWLKQNPGKNATVNGKPCNTVAG